MIWKAHRCISVLLLCVILVAPGHLAWGSPSGLDNIPTTDSPSKGVLVLQTWSNIAENALTQQYVGFKTGLTDDLEVGVDWKANDKTHGHPTLQAKYSFDIRGDRLRGVVGIANLSDSRDHNGEYFPYVATSLNAGLVRLHGGYAPQRYNEAFFGGIDKTVTFRGRNLQLKADAIQTNDKEDMLYSVGFLYEFGRRGAPEGEEIGPGLGGFLNSLLKDMVLEAWTSIPDTGAEEVYTVKLNYVIKF